MTLRSEASEAVGAMLQVKGQHGRAWWSGGGQKERCEQNRHNARPSRPVPLEISDIHRQVKQPTIRALTRSDLCPMRSPRTCLQWLIRAVQPSSSRSLLVLDVNPAGALRASLSPWNCSDEYITHPALGTHL